MKKVCLSIGVLERGGAELRILQLVRSLSVRGDIKFYLYVISGEKGSLYDDFIDSGASVRLGKSGLLGLVDFFIFLRSLSPDVVHCNSSLASGVYAFVGWLAGVPIRISHIRTANDYGAGLLYLAKKRIFRFFINTFSTRIIGVCNLAKSFSGSKDAKWVTIYNGFPLSDSIRKPFDGVNGRIVVLGRMHPVKNQVFAIDVLNALCTIRKDIHWTLDYYGAENGHIKHDMEKRAALFNIADRVFFRGMTRSPYDALVAYDLLLLPSVREGLPGVVVEAGMCGVPAVCSDAGGCPELSDALSFVKSVPHFSAQEWADIVLSLISLSPSAIAAEAGASKFHVEKYIESILYEWGV